MHIEGIYIYIVSRKTYLYIIYLGCSLKRVLCSRFTKVLCKQVKFFQKPRKTTGIIVSNREPKSCSLFFFSSFKSKLASLAFSAARSLSFVAACSSVSTLDPCSLHLEHIQDPSALLFLMHFCTRVPHSEQMNPGIVCKNGASP